MKSQNITLTRTNAVLLNEYLDYAKTLDFVRRDNEKHGIARNDSTQNLVARSNAILNVMLKVNNVKSFCALDYLLVNIAKFDKENNDALLYRTYEWLYCSSLGKEARNNAKEQAISLFNQYKVRSYE